MSPFHARKTIYREAILLKALMPWLTIPNTRFSNDSASQLATFLPLCVHACSATVLVEQQEAVKTLVLMIYHIFLAAAFSTCRHPTLHNYQFI
jgi:hypothetical protein